MSLFSIMNVANRALYASQLCQDVTSQNMANADVAGYSRKRVDMSAAYHRDSTYGQFGFGVEINSITRIRSSHIDAQIRRQSHELGKHQAVDYTLESIENILREPSDTGIESYMNRFFDSWENLANNPSDQAARTAMLTSANTLADVFHNVAGELETLKETRNQEILSVTEKINTIAEEIFNLNGEIALVNLNNGQMPNDSLDRRDQLMRELSLLIDFDTQTSSNGETTITINGNILVSPISVNKLEVYEDATTRTNPDANYHQYGIRMSKGKNQINPLGGELKGLLISRDETIPKYEKQLDELVKGFVTAINDQHRLGFNMDGFVGFDFFDPTGLTARDIKLSAVITTNINNIAAAGGADAPLKATQNNILSTDLWVSDGATPPSYLPKNPVQLTKDGNTAAPVIDTNIIRNVVAGSVSVFAIKAGSSQQQLIEGTHYKIDYALGTIQMIDDDYAGYDIKVDLQYASSGEFTGVGNNANAIAMSELRKKLTMNESILGEKSATFDQFYGSTVSSLGLDRKEALANIDTREYLIEQYDMHQDSIAGVNMDEEMANLVKYQYTYRAAARILTTAQEMLDILMSI